MKNLVLIILVLICLHSTAQNGKQFPKMQGTTLDGKSLALPYKNNKYTVVAIAYSRDAEDDLKKWLNPLYSMFIKKGESSNFDMAEIYDVNFIFIPMISGFKRIADDFKKGTDKEFWAYILDTEKTDVKELQAQLQVTDNKIPYFYVLDKNGKIVTTQSGKYTDDKIEKLEDAIE
jgi:ATP synthase subunit 10